MRRRIKVPCILKREGFLNFLGEPCSLISIIIHKQYPRYSWATENDLQSHANKTKQNKTKFRAICGWNSWVIGKWFAYHEEEMCLQNFDILKRH
jgi:hypothetical protein